MASYGRTCLGMGLSVYSKKELDEIALELSMRPRKRFDFKCPIEMMGELMAKYHEARHQLIELVHLRLLLVAEVGREHTTTLRCRPSGGAHHFGAVRTGIICLSGIFSLPQPPRATPTKLVDTTHTASTYRSSRYWHQPELVQSSRRTCLIHYFKSHIRAVLAP